MLDRKELQRIARSRLKDAHALLAAGRFDGAIYICGYAVELWLKARICRTLRWTEFPSPGGKFKNYESYKTHDLDVLLHLSGREEHVKSPELLTEWSIVAKWNPEARYQPVGTATRQDAQSMIEATGELIRRMR